MTAGSPRGVRVFISYSHRDADLLAELREHLGALKHERIIEVWSDLQIQAGDLWDAEIFTELNVADLILLLISRAFIDSIFCYKEEMHRAVERHDAKTARVIPIILRPCYWEPAPFAKIQGLPKGMKPITDWPEGNSRDAVWRDVVKAIHEVVRDIHRAMPTADSCNEDRRAWKEADNSRGLTGPSDKLDRRFQLPADLPDFTGRARHVEQLLEFFKRPGTQAAVACIRGMGGLGKSALAIRVAHHLKDHFPDAQLVVDLNGTSASPRTWVQAMGSIIHSFHPQAQLPEDSEELQHIYTTTLTDKKVMLVLDNARDARQVEKLIPPSLCAVIITSRKIIAIPGARLIPLEPLPDDDAPRLLQNITPRLDQANARTIAGLCGGLPLALRAAGSFLNVHPDWSIDHYIQALSNQSEKLQALRLDQASINVGCTLALSAAELVREDRGAEFLLQWQMLSVFPGSFDLDGAAAVWELPKASALNTLSTLHEHTLLLYDEKDRRYRLHDLMAPVARKAFRYADYLDYPEEGQTLENAAKLHSTHYVAVLRRAVADFRESARILEVLALFDRELHNIRAGQAWSAMNYRTNREAAILCNNYPLVGESFLTLRLRPKKWIKWLQAGLAAARLLPDPKGQAIHLRRLGTAHHELGRSAAARRCLKRASKIIEQLDEPGEQSHIMIKLAQGEPIKRTPLETALQIARSSKNKRPEMFALAELAAVKRDFGETGEALNDLEQALGIAREIGDVTVKARILDGFGVFYQDLGDLDNAEKYYSEALEIADQINDSRRQCSVLDHLGAVYRSLGDFPNAINCGKQALDIARELADLSQEAHIWGEMGIACRMQGKGSEAIKYHESQLKIADQLGDRRMRARAVDNLGLDYEVRGEPDRAIDFHKEALQIMEREDDRYATAWVCAHLAAIYADSGDTKPASHYAEKALAIFQESKFRRARGGGEGYVSGILGSIMHRCGKLDQAAEFYKIKRAKAIEGKDRLGEGHAYAYLGALHRDLKQYSLAMELFKQAREIIVSFGDRRGDARVLNDIGITHRMLDKPREAIKHHEEAISIVRAIDNPREEGQSLFNKALALDKADERSQAIACAEEALNALGTGNTDLATLIGQRIDLWKGSSHVVDAPSVPSQSLEENLPEKIFPLFPSGKRKALIMSYDDGSIHDRRLVSIFNQYAICATFHLNSGKLGQDSYISPEEVNLLYHGHEVASHTVTHRDLTDLSDEEVRMEVLNDKQALEQFTGYSIRGLAYPFGHYDDRVVSLMSGVDIDYARTVDDTSGYSIAENFLRMTTTCHHSLAMPLAEMFLRKEGNMLGAMIIWGHSYELEGYMTEDVTKDWNYMEQLCCLIHGSDKIWYTSTIQLVEYIRALRMLKRVDTSILNSSRLPLWVEWNGTSVELAPGTSASLW